MATVVDGGFVETVEEGAEVVGDGASVTGLAVTLEEGAEVVGDGASVTDSLGEDDGFAPHEPMISAAATIPVRTIQPISVPIGG